MTRMIKLLFITGFSSVYLMALPCTFAEHGFSMIPNGIIPNPFAAIPGFLGIGT